MKFNKKVSGIVRFLEKNITCFMVIFIQNIWVLVLHDSTLQLLKYRLALGIHF